MTKLASVLVVVTLAAPVSARAQQAVGSLEDLWTRVKSGNTVYVTDASARETTGTFVKIADSALTVLIDGAVRDIPARDVRQIEKRGDSLKNGFLLGAVFGAAIMTVAVLQCDAECEGPDPQFPSGPLIVVGTLEFGGIGALIDYFIKGRTVVYRAATSGARIKMAPLMIAHGRGVQVSIAF